MSKIDLVQIIRDNTGAVAIIDNDHWSLYKAHPEDVADEDEAQAANLLASSDDPNDLIGEGYGSGNCYGGDILQALAIIVGIAVESV